MTRVFNSENKVTPVTIVSIDSNRIAQIKSDKTDGYHSIQVAYSQKKNLNKSVSGHLKKNQLESALKITEFRLKNEATDIKVGQELKIDQFKVGDLVSLSGISKGKGFSGTVKRYGFKIGPKTHGSNNQRRPGSIGATTPQHVIKGKKMPGHLGHEKRTIHRRKIIDILPEQNSLLINGSLPGAKGSIIKIWQLL